MKTELLNMCKCGRGRCPRITLDTGGDEPTIILGGEEEGFTVWKLEHFADFIQEAKNGKFDELPSGKPDNR